MSMYFLDGETFLKEYIKEDPKIVMRTQFILVSSTIRKGGRYDKQVINANNILYPDQQLIMDYTDYKVNKHYKEAYLEQIEENKAFLAHLIKSTIEDDLTLVFLCGKKEKKYCYLKLIRDFVENEFGYQIIDYKKLKKGKEKIYDFDKAKVIKRCNKTLDAAKKEQREKQLSTERGREQLIKSMSKKEMKKELKEHGLYHDGMTKGEMRDMLDVFM